MNLSSSSPWQDSSHRCAASIAVWLLLFLTPGQTAAWAVDPPATNTEENRPLVLVDQFDREHTLTDFRGDIVVLVYGDRKATKDCREIGEALHITFHPQAADLPVAEGHRAPVKPLAGLPAGQPSPNVHIIPVACTGPVPKPIRTVVQQQFRKGSPVVPVWLDFDGELKQRFGQDEHEPNLVVFDARGGLRLQLAGRLDDRQKQVLVQRIEGLRAEALK